MKKYFVLCLLLMLLLLTACTPDTEESASVTLPALETVQKTDNADRETRSAATDTAARPSAEESNGREESAGETTDAGQATTETKAVPQESAGSTEAAPGTGSSADASGEDEEPDQPDPGGLEVEDDYVVEISDGQDVGGN